jgi:hypothetical protein
VAAKSPGPDTNCGWLDGFDWALLKFVIGSAWAQLAAATAGQTMGQT